MSAPLIISSYPPNSSTDITLNTLITVTFNQLLDTSTINNRTFSVQGPGQSQISTQDQSVISNQLSTTGREYVTGVFSFSLDLNGATIVTFTPDRSLQPNSTYKIILSSSSGLLVSSAIKNPDGEALINSYVWSFQTGTANTIVPPVSPLFGPINNYINPKSIRVIANPINGDINQNIASGYSIQIIFPTAIDTNSFDPNDILASIEPILSDPTLSIPINLVPLITINNKTITVTLT